MPDVPDATDNESAREEEKENSVDETIIFNDNDNKESAMEMDSGNETINDSITFPNQTSSSATDSFVERKESIEGGERTDLLHVVATGNDDPSSSVGQNILVVKETEHHPEKLPRDENDIKEASIVWSPRLLLAISVVLVSCCSNVIFLELLVRQVF